MKIDKASTGMHDNIYIYIYIYIYMYIDVYFILIYIMQLYSI